MIKFYSVLISLYLIAMLFFFVGTHNIDLAFNRALNNEKHNEVFISGEELNTRETYLRGIRLIGLSFISFLTTLILLLFSGKL